MKRIGIFKIGLISLFWEPGSMCRLQPSLPRKLEVQLFQPGVCGIFKGTD